MLKITAIVSLVLIGSSMFAAGLSCDSCGSECASACGTRNFRSCCFNYLRKKRGHDAKFWTPSIQDVKEVPNRPPIFFVKSLPASWRESLPTNDIRPYSVDDNADNRLQIVYDA